MNVLALKFAGSLGITLLIEIPVALLFHARGKDILLVLLVNVLTNPAVVLLSELMGNEFLIQIILEIMVWGIEGCYYKRYSINMRNVFVCSLCCNAASYIMGIVMR